MNPMVTLTRKQRVVRISSVMEIWNRRIKHTPTKHISITNNLRNNIDFFLPKV